jgi:hypothetical protein
MTLPPIVSIAALLMALPQTAPACTISLVPHDGQVDATAQLTPAEDGNLSYTVSTIVTNGGNRSQSMNGSEMNVSAGAGPVTVWRGQILSQAGTRIAITLDASLNTHLYNCSAQFP